MQVHTICNKPITIHFFHRLSFTYFSSKRPSYLQPTKETPLKESTLHNMQAPGLPNHFFHLFSSLRPLQPRILTLNQCRISSLRFKDVSPYKKKAHQPLHSPSFTFSHSKHLQHYSFFKLLPPEVGSILPILYQGDHLDLERAVWSS